MSKREDGPVAVEIDEARLDDVAGGPIYWPPEGIPGITAVKPAASGANILLGDGSVRTVR